MYMYVYVCMVQIWPEGVLRHRGWEYICLKLRILRHRAWECVCLNLRILRHRAWECVCLNLRILRHRAWECVCLNLRQTYSQALCLRILNIHSPPLPGQGQSPQGPSPWPGACPVPWPRSVPLARATPPPPSHHPASPERAKYRTFC